MTITNKVILLTGRGPLLSECKEWFQANNHLVIALEELSSYQNQVELAVEVTNADLFAKRKTIQMLDAKLPVQVPILSTSLAITATEIASWIPNPERICGFGTFVPLCERELIEVAPALQTTAEIVDKVVRFIQELGKEVELVDDEVGLVFPRVLSLIINEAVFAVMEGTATPEDIDIAMKKGTNYPYGPLEWADQIGLDEVYSVVSGLWQNLREERYRPASLLRKLVLAGRYGKRSGQGIYNYDKSEVQ